MKKIIIIGTTGAGKTTLAKKLTEKLGLAFTDLDDLNHLPGWQARPHDELRQLTDAATAKSEWVIAGNYSKLRDLTWDRADTVIWLDYPFFKNLGQLAYRSFHRAQSGELCCNGNTETWRQLFFSKESILLWFLKTFRKNKRQYNEIFSAQARYPHLSFIRLQSPQQTEQWLKSL